MKAFKTCDGCNQASIQILEIMNDVSPSCSICLNLLSEPPSLLTPNHDGSTQTDISITTTPCNHLFHTFCLNEWTSNHPTCPECRYSLIPPETFLQRLVQKIIELIDAIMTSITTSRLVTACGATIYRGLVFVEEYLDQILTGFRQDALNDLQDEAWP